MKVLIVGRSEIGRYPITDLITGNNRIQQLPAGGVCPLGDRERSGDDRRTGVEQSWRVDVVELDGVGDRKSVV